MHCAFRGETFQIHSERSFQRKRVFRISNNRRQFRAIVLSMVTIGNPRHRPYSFVVLRSTAERISLQLLFYGCLRSSCVTRFLLTGFVPQKREAFVCIPSYSTQRSFSIDGFDEKQFAGDVFVDYSNP